MTPETIGILVVGVLIAAIIGYLVGARLGAAAQDRLRQTIKHREEELRRARLEMRAVLKAEKSERIRTLDLAATSAAMAAPPERSEPPEASATEPAEAEVDQLAAQVREVMGPLAAVAQVQAALTTMPDTFTHRGQLEAMLDEVVARAALTYVVLSDEAGLPLAASHADSADAVAAAASVVLTLADRMENTGEPTAVGAVVHDAESRRIVHRIFSTGKERYVMTAVAEGVTLGPDALDPVLARVRRLLRKPGPVSDVA